MNYRPHKLITTLIMIAFLAACSSTVTVKEDTTAAIEQLEIDNRNFAAQENADNFANTGWLSNLNDARLNDFVEIALKQNNNLLANAANVEASIVAIKTTNANLYPSLSASLANSTNEVDTGTSISTVDSASASFNISWEIDIWRQLSQQKQAALFSSQAEIANYKAAQLALVANVARAWFNINSNKLRLDLAEQRLASQRNTLAVTEEEYKSGAQSALDVYASRTDVETQIANVIELQQSLDDSIRSFKRLLGQYPDIRLDFAANLPAITETVPAGLPSELLLRRPDIIASKARWESSKRSASAANRARFPSFSLTLSYGASSDSLSELSSASLLGSLAANLTAPIFNSGALQAQADQAALQANASLFNYIDTLLLSFNEVENTLSNEQRLRSRLSAIEQSAFYSQSGFELAQEQYRSGLIDYTTLLNAERRWFDAQSNKITLQNALLQNRIDLNLALGGDFTFATEESNNNE